MTTSPTVLRDVAMLADAKLSQAVAEARAETLAEITAADTARQRTEDLRSIRRNRNRVLMILVAWVASLGIPVVANVVLHSPTFASYGASVGFTGDLLVTGYALIRRY